MKIPIPLQIFALGLFTLILASVVTAVAAANIVPSTRVTSQTFPVTANDLKPSACAGLYLTHIISGSGTITSVSGNALILGSSGSDTINGAGGNNCIVGGGGDDTIDGGAGTNICIRGPGNDTFTNCSVISP